MNSYWPMPAMSTGFPRYFSTCRTTVNAYKVFLCIGVYVGSLVTAALADSSGMSPLRIGLGAMASALAGLIGARLYDLLVHAPVYRKQLSWCALWDRNRGGWSVFGALLTFVPVSFGAARLLGVPAALFFDHVGLGVLAGVVSIRLGCVFNGCCAGRESVGRLGVWLRDTQSVIKWRIPVQFFEMGWWLLGGVVKAVISLRSCSSAIWLIARPELTAGSRGSSRHAAGRWAWPRPAADPGSGGEHDLGLHPLQRHAGLDPDHTVSTASQPQSRQCTRPSSACRLFAGVWHFLTAHGHPPQPMRCIGGLREPHAKVDRSHNVHPDLTVGEPPLLIGV